MAKVILFCVAALLFLSCSPTPSDKVIAKIGSTAIYDSDAEFLAAIRPESGRDKKAIETDLQQLADNRIMAEAARRLYAGSQSKIQNDMAESEDARLAQVYTYFYLRTNLGNADNALIDYYNKNKSRYADSLTFTQVREKVAGDLFISNLLAENIEGEAAKVNDSNKTAFLDSARRTIAQSEFDKLKEIYKIAEVKIENPAAEEYYKTHLDEFMTLTEYKVLILSDADSAKLAEKTLSLQDSNAQANRAKFIEMGAVEMPLIKHGHAVIGIGMFPSLFDALAKTAAGSFTPILKSTDTVAYHAFYLDSAISPKQKSWDRAKWQARSIIEGNGDIPLDSSTVLAVADGKPIVTERDVLKFQENVHPQRLAMFRRAVVVKNLMERYAYARAAREKGIDKSLEYTAWNRQLADQAYSQVLIDSLLSVTLGVPEDSLKAAYEAEKDSLFSAAADGDAQSQYEKSKLDVAVWLRIPDISYRKEFALNGSRYGVPDSVITSSGDAWKPYKRAMYKNIRYREFAGLQTRELAELQKAIPVTLVDTSWHLEFLPSDEKKLVLLAKLKYESRDLNGADKIWSRVRLLFPNNDSLQRMASFELANINQELGLYQNATNEYELITKLWSKDENTYKAYFMWGFVLNEYEKKDSLALKVFEEMLSKFPNSDLSDDAKIMADNIRSGGKVLEELLKKIEADTSSGMPNAEPTPE